MVLQTAMPGGSAQVRQGRVPGIQAILQGQQRVSTKRHDEGFFLQRQDRRVARLRPYGGIMPVGALRPLRDRLRVDSVALGQLR
jgi:hypothetical protein